MSMFICKMCGGALDVNPGDTVVECDYCGTQQTLPKPEKPGKYTITPKSKTP